MSNSGQDGKIGTCRKCGNEIPLDAETCPECGFDRSLKLIGKILVWAAVIVGSSLLVVAISSLFVITDGVSIVDALTALSVTGFGSVFFLTFVYREMEVYKQKPAIQPAEILDGNDNEYDGNGIRNSETIGKAGIPLQNPLWTVVILIGILFSLSAWGFLHMGYSNSVWIAIVVSMGILGYAVLNDVKRVNRTTDSDYTWWVYTLGAIIPAIGVIPSLIWLGRKKRTIGGLL